MVFKRDYNKYEVIKLEDIEKYLTPIQRDKLWAAIATIQLGREADGKIKCNHYVVVNEDEPYAEIVWELIKTEVNNPGKNSNLYNGLLNGLRTFR